MNAIEISGLCKKYPGFSLNNVSFSLPQGSVMGLIGENGAGKSTVIRLILDMIKSDGGDIRVLGKSNRHGFEITKQDIGVVLGEQVFSPKIRISQINKVMKEAYRTWDSGLFNQLLNRFRLVPRSRYGNLSLGMKMSLSFVIALAHRPKLLIFDEPTNGLDPVARDEVVRLIFDYTRSEDRSVLISSHIVTDLEKVCDYIAFLHHGSLLFCQDKESIYEQYGIIQCTEEQSYRIPAECVVGREDGPYSVTLLVRRNEMLPDIKIEKADIERMFVLIMKNGKNDTPVNF